MSLFVNRDSLFTLVLRLLCSWAMRCMRKMDPFIISVLKTWEACGPLSYIWLSFRNPDLGLGGGWPRLERSWGRVLASLYME